MLTVVFSGLTMSVQKQSPSGKRRGSPESEVCGYDSVVREKGMNVMNNTHAMYALIFLL